MTMTLMLSGAPASSARATSCGGLAGIGGGRQDVPDRLSAHDRAQAIRAQQVTVAGPQVTEAEIRRPVRPAVEVPREHRRQGPRWRQACP